MRPTGFSSPSTTFTCQSSRGRQRKPKIIGGKLLANLEAGNFFGEMALVDDSPRSATAIVDEDNTQLVVLDQNRFTYLLLHQPDFALLVMGTLCQRLREANKAIMLNEARHGG